MKTGDSTRQLLLFRKAKQTASGQHAIRRATLGGLACLMSATFLAGCAATHAYFVDRGRDALDLFTVVGGVGVGVDARVGPVMQGVYVSQDWLGLQAGEFFLGKNPAMEWLYDDPAVASIICLGSEVSNASELNQRRGKAFSNSYFLGLNESLGSHSSKALAGQISLAIGLGPSLRLGFNWLELLDFVTGWVGLDLLHDDLERQKVSVGKQTKP